jgi:4-amino-4-deoxy-L-arabinose transferase-like glycosyltransferase
MALSRKWTTIRGKRVISVLILAVAVSARFWGAALFSLRHAGYLGAATVRLAVLVCIGLVALAALLSVFGSPSLRRRAAIALSVAAALFVGSAAAASHTFLQIAGALLILLTAFGAGSAVLAWFHIESDFSVLERGALAAGLGLGLLSHLTLLLALLRLLYPAIAFGALAALLAATRRFLWRGAQVIWAGARGVLADQAPGRLFLLGAVLVFLSIGAVQTMAPAVQYDDLHYHLYAPAQHVAAHRLTLLPDVIQSFFYQGVEMLYTLAFLVGGETTAIFLNCAFGVLTALALAGFAGRVFSRDAAWMSVLFWTTTPLIAWLMTTGYVDVAAAFYSFLCAIAAFGWMRRADRRLALLAGALAGFAVGVKLNAVLFIMALMLTLLTAAWFERRFRDSALFAAFFAVGALPAGCVWPLLRFIQTGNPVYPFLNGIFRAPGLPFANEWMNFGLFGMGSGIGALLALPWNLSFHAERFVEALHPYVLGPCLLLAVAACLVALPWPRGELRWAISVAALYSIAWFFRVQYLRYLLPALPLVALIAAVCVCRALQSLGPAPSRAALTMVGVLVACPSLVIWAASCFNIPELRVIFGLESRDAYRARIVPVYQAFAAVGKACTSPSRGVLTILNEYGYLCPAMVVWTAPRASLVWEPATDSAYREMLRKLDIAYVVIDDPLEKARTLPFVASGFLDRAGEILYHGRSATAIRLLAPGERPSRQIVQAQPQAEGAPYQPGVFEAVDPTFENGPSPDSPWEPVFSPGKPILNVGSDPRSYQPAKEGKRALYVSLPGPSDDRKGGEASAAFPKATVRVEPGRAYEFSFDMLCSGLYVTPVIKLHFSGAGAAGQSVATVAVNAACDAKWRRLRADLTVPEGATGLYPEFGFTFTGDFAYARYVELDRLALAP